MIAIFRIILHYVNKNACFLSNNAVILHACKIKETQIKED